LPGEGIRQKRQSTRENSGKARTELAQKGRDNREERTCVTKKTLVSEGHAAEEEVGNHDIKDNSAGA
jgi:hypothetical protein